MLWWIVTIELFHAKFSVQSSILSYYLIPFTLKFPVHTCTCSYLHLTTIRPTLVDLISLYPKKLSRGFSEHFVGTASMTEAAKETRSPFLTLSFTPVGC